jgi:hypothetical protein
LGLVINVVKHLTRWLIPLPAILFAVIPQNANAEPISGLNTTYYTIDVIPPVQSTSEYPVCGTETENNINRNYDGELFEDCTYDLFMVHMTGYITIPEHNTIEFMLASDDGGTIKIGLDEWGNWNDQGCTWMMSGPLELDAGSQPLDLWMYENGGGACLMLAWNINDAGWEIVPDNAFTTNAVLTTTTTVQETTTSWVPSTTSTTTTTTTTTIVETTTVPATTTTVAPSTTTTTTTEPVQTSTTTSTTSTTVTPTTTTEAPYTPPQTSTTVPEPEPESSPTNETQPETTTTVPATTIDESETTEPETSTTVPDETVPEPVEPDETTIPETTVPEILDEPVLDETEQPTEPLEPEEDISETTQLTVQSSSTTSVLFLENEPIDDEQFSAIIESIDEATPEQIVAIIETVLAADVTSEQAAELVSNVAILQVITESEAEQLFSEVVPAELSEEQAALIVEAVQSAPKEVREAFEAVIDIFGSQFENYVPTGSNIPVNQRRTLVAIGATLTMLPAPRVKR